MLDVPKKETKVHSDLISSVDCYSLTAQFVLQENKREPNERTIIGNSPYKLDDETIVNISAILAQMSTVFYRLSLIKEADPSSKVRDSSSRMLHQGAHPISTHQDKTGMGGREVLVSEEDIGQLITFLFNTLYPSSNYYVVRTSTLPPLSPVYAV